MSALPATLSRLVILLGLGCLVLGSRRAGTQVSLLVGAAVAALLVLSLAQALVAGRHKRRWRRMLERHRTALTRRYRQLVRVNDYGAEEYGKWYAELDRFRASTGLPGEPVLVAAFERDATRLVQRWVLREREDSEDPAFVGHDPHAFEHHCAEVMRRAGWEASVTAGSGDQGVDVLAQLGALSVAVQCKLHNAPVGNKAVQEVHAAMGFVDAEAAAVVSNADYTASARELAAKLGVLLLHHEDLPNLKTLLEERRPRRLAGRRG